MAKRKPAKRVVKKKAKTTGAAPKWREKGWMPIPPEKRHKKQKGEKDRIPGQRKVKRTMKSIAQQIFEEKHLTLKDAVLRGVKSGASTSHHYLKLLAEYNEGKPESTHHVTFDQDELATAKASLMRKLETVLEQLQKPK